MLGRPCLQAVTAQTTAAHFILLCVAPEARTYSDAFAMQVVTTISQGKVLWNNGKVSVEPGSGRFIRRQPFAPHIYQGIKEQEARWIADEFPYGPVPVKRQGDRTHEREEL